LEAFKKDAAQHRVDLSHISREDVELTWKPESYTESRGFAFKVCDPNKLSIGLRQTDWDERIVADFNKFIISLIWYEFGHTILGLKDLCQGWHIMSGRYQKPTSNRISFGM